MMLTLLAFILLTTTGNLAEIPAGVPKPFDRIAVIALLVGHLPSDRLARYVSNRGISFHASDDYLEALRTAGGQDVLIEAIKKATASWDASHLDASAPKSAGAQPSTLEIGPQEASGIQRLIHASQMEKQNSHTEAALDIRTTLQDFPHNAYLHFDLGKLLPFQGEPGWDAGIEEERESIRLDPSFADPHFSLGVAYRLKRDNQTSAAEYREAARIDPLWETPHFQLATILEEQGDLDGAVTEYQAVVRLEPEAEYAHIHLATALIAKGDLPGAIFQAHEAARLKPDDPGPHGVWGKALRQSGDEKGGDEQVRIYHELASKQPVPKRIRLGGQITAARLISHPSPKYPHDAKAAGIQGVVRLEVIIGKDGTVKDMKTLSGDPSLVKAAVEAVSNWTYKPFLLNGEAIEVVAEVDINFSLSR